MRARLIALCAIVVAVAACAVPASAYWGAGGTGGDTGSVASMTAAAITVPSSAMSTVTVSIGEQSSLVPSVATSSAITYSVERKPDDGAFAAVTSGGCAGTMPWGTASCDDSPPASGGYTYRLVATYLSWTATSSATGPVSVTTGTTPSAQSIVRAVTDPSNAASVSWTVTFSEPVSGVDGADFSLARSGGVSGGAITSVTGSAATYTVTASTGSGDGTLGVNLVDDDSIVNAALNPLGGSGAGNGDLIGQVYTLDRSAPLVASILTADANPTNAASASWTVTFSEPVSGVDATDFALARSGTVSGGAITSVSGSGATRTVTATTGTGEGALGLNLSSDGTIKDLAGNAHSGAVTGASYTIDRTAPARVWMQMLDADANGKVDQVKVTFDETLASSTATTPWTLDNVPSGGTLASVSTSGTIATLTLNEGGGAADTAVGSFKVALAAGAGGVRDAAGNQSAFAATAPIDLAAPARTSLRTLDSNTNGKIDRVTAAFSETLATPVLATVFTLTDVPSGGTLLTANTATDTVTLTLNEGGGAADTAVGSFKVALAAGASGVRDAAGNQSSFAATAPADKAGPVPVALSDTNGAINGRMAEGDSFSITFSEAIAAASLPASTPISETRTSGSNAFLSIAGVTNGALNMGATGYVSGSNGSVTSGGTSLLSGDGRTVTVTVTAGTCSCAAARTGSTTFTYLPAATLLDAAGNTAAGSRATTSAFF